MKYELVIFDWDGTLVDSTGRIVDSMQQAGNEVGLPVVPDSAVQNIIGLGLPEALRTIWPEINTEQAARMTEVYARNFVYDSQVAMDFFPGIDALLPQLRAQGRQLAVATGKSRRGLDRMFVDLEIDGRGVGEQFVASRCADETRSKPDPCMLNELLAQLKIPVDRALMVGDTSYDLMMAAEIGMASVGLTHGAHDEEVLLACEPVTICHSIQQLNDWITTYG